MSTLFLEETLLDIMALDGCTGCALLNSRGAIYIDTTMIPGCYHMVTLAQFDP